MVINVFIYEQISFFSAHSAMLLTNGGPMSPQSPGPENFPSNNYDLPAQLRKKELFSQRKQREFIPDAKKDESYWDRRRRNNEAAKRSREKRRFNDMVLEQRVVELTKENHVLKAQLEAIKDKYNICGENLVSVDQIMATLPTSEQVLSITKRTKLSHGTSPSRGTPLLYPGTPSPVPTSVIHQNIGTTVSPSPQQMQQQQMNMNSQMASQSPPQSAAVLHHPHIAANNTNTTTNSHNSGSVSPPSIVHHHHLYARQQHPASPQPISRGDEHENEFQSNQPHLHHHHHPYATYQDRTAHYTNGASVLNLSRRAHSPYEVSSGGSIASMDEEHDLHENINNSLPLKLRHKSHLGDKDAATALLALQNIKQEPNPRASPLWDGEGSSDERDSGISIGAPEWTATIQRKIIVPTEPSLQDKEEENIHLKSQLARLESEVATIKNMMILNTSSGATAAAQ